MWVNLSSFGEIFTNTQNWRLKSTAQQIWSLANLKAGAMPCTVGPNTRLEFKRGDASGYVDVELPRAEYVALRDRLGLKPGSAVHLRPRKVTRFAEELPDPAAMI